MLEVGLWLLCLSVYLNYDERKFDLEDVLDSIYYFLGISDCLERDLDLSSLLILVIVVGLCSRPTSPSVVSILSFLLPA